MVMILAVVKRVEGKVDEILDERLELGVDFLCISPETKPQKDLNKVLMTSLREEAQKRGAK